jgi:hypothetical protein
MNSGLQISLKNGTPAEARMREIVTSLPREYNLAGWILTNVIEIDEGCWPHSHPVLTLNTAFEQNVTMVLTEFVHEQLHWFEEEHADRRDLAIEETKRYYRDVPSARPEGAGDELSTRLHLLICYLEYQAMKLLTGPEKAKEVMLALSRHHYCWVYRTILRDEEKLAGIIRKYDLVPEPLRERVE